MECLPRSARHLWNKQREREMFYFIFGWSRYRDTNPVPTSPLADDITTAPSFLRPHPMVKDHSDSEKGNRCRHIGYSYRLTARVLLYAPSHRQDNTYHSLCYTSRGALAGTRNSSMGPPHEGSIRRPIAP